MRKKPSILKQKPSILKQKLSILKQKPSILKQKLSILRQKLNNPSKKVAHHRTQWEKMNWPKSWPIWANMINLPVRQTSIINPRKEKYLKNHMQRIQGQKEKPPKE